MKTLKTKILSKTAKRNKERRKKETKTKTSNLHGKLLSVVRFRPDAPSREQSIVNFSATGLCVI